MSNFLPIDVSRNRSWQKVNSMEWNLHGVWGGDHGFGGLRLIVVVVRQRGMGHGMCMCMVWLCINKVHSSHSETMLFIKEEEVIRVD